MFLKAGVYYTNKLDTVRKQCFEMKLFSYELIRIGAQEEYLKGNHDRACRKYEEALSIFRYYFSKNPKWNEEGIDDDELGEVDDKGKTPEQEAIIKDIKIACFLNIASCCVKSKEFPNAILAANEVL